MITHDMLVNDLRCGGRGFADCGKYSCYECRNRSVTEYEEHIREEARAEQSDRIQELKEYVTDLEEENENLSEYNRSLVEKIKELEDV